MSNVLRGKAFLFSSLALAISANHAVAGGFEKATMWDAEYSALAGAAVSSVNNSSAIFFNPAGLARVEGNDIALHVSPTVVQANGPANGSDYTKGERVFVPNGGFTSAYRLSDDLVLGFGVYGAGGASAKYEDITISGGLSTQTGDYSTDIKIIETGLGLGYQINDNWSIGGAYRLTYAYADINMMSSVPVLGGAKVGYNDMSGFNNFSVRIGAQYRSDDDRWGFGINYRSEVEVEADGKALFNHNGPNIPAVIPPTYANRDATAVTALPTQVSVGADYQLNQDWQLFGEVTYSNYSSIDQIKFESDEHLQVEQLYTNWDDQWNFRFATEYTGVDSWALRAGYIYTTAVVPEEYAAPTFSTPAAAHTFTFGAGTAFMEDQLLFDVAAEYNYSKNSNAKGGGNMTDTSKSASGRYDSNAIAVHATLRYMF